MNARQPEFESTIDWLALTGKIKSDDPKGRDELYRVFSGGIRFFLNRRLGPADLQARHRETFEILIYAIKTEDLREHGSLVRFVRWLVLRQVAIYSYEGALKGLEPFDAARRGDWVCHSQSNRKMERMTAVFKSMSPHDLEALTRFYGLAQTQARICYEMRLSNSEFLVLKKRVKASMDRD